MERAVSPTPSCASQDCSHRAPPRSAYRLFPTVEPTPPATPVKLHFNRCASVSKASRSPSTSSDNAAKELLPAKGHAAAAPSASRDARKANLPELRINTEASPRSDSASQPRNLALRDMALATRSSPKPLTPVLELHSQGGRLRTRERPNLRIAINKDQADNKPLPLPPKSPEYPRNYAENGNAASSSPAQQSSLPASSGRPVTPVQLAQQHSLTPVNGDVKVFWPPAPRGQLSEKPLPPIGVFSPAPSVSPDHVKGIVKQPPRITLRSRLLPGSKQKPRQDVGVRPKTPEERQTKASKVWNDVLSTAPLMNRRSVTPDPLFGRPDDAGALSATDIFLDATRPSSAQSNHDHDSATPQATSSKPSPESTVPQTLSRSAGAALAAARANVAALRNADSTGSPELVRTPASVQGTFSRSTSDRLCRRPSYPGPGDPVMMLKDLSDQYETLHARYASLRAERQKLSSSIIGSLQDLKSGPEYVNKLLDDQLTLAAISSSMDVCFARLKSLDCRREDAIAALVAKASQPEISPSDNIAAMIASMAVSRKTSVTTDSSQYGPTGRSTPDCGESSSFNRFTQPSLRSLSYASEAESIDSRISSLSRQASIGAESNHHTDSTERQAPETIPEVVESPEPLRTTHQLETVQNPTEWKSSHPSPLSEMKHESVGALDAAVAPGAVAARRLRPSGSDESLDALLEGRPQKSRVQGAKAAKVLGLLEQSQDDQDTLMLKIPGLLNDALAKDTKAERDGEGNVGDVKGHSPSLLSELPNDMEDPVSPDIGDLDLRMQSFPRPQRLSSLPKSNKRDTGGSMLTNGSSADSSNGEQEPLPTPRSGRDTTKSASHPDAAARKRDPSAHTIQVYLEHDDVLEYYDGAYRSRRA